MVAAQDSCHHFRVWSLRAKLHRKDEFSRGTWRLEKPPYLAFKAAKNVARNRFRIYKDAVTSVHDIYGLGATVVHGEAESAKPRGEA